MNRRYLIFVWNRHEAETARAAKAFRDALTATEWSVAYEGPGALMVHAGRRQAGPQVYLLKNNSGLVLGRIFDRRHADYSVPRQVHFDERETQRIVDSGGRHLIDQYWGAYVALAFDASTDKHHVFRDPTCMFPCHHANHNGLHVFFSYIEDCIRFLPISFWTNRRYLTHYLATCAPVATRDTGLQNVENLLVGESLTFHRSQVVRNLLWDPAEIARSPRFSELSEAARDLRLVVQHTIDAWASNYQRIALKLSGGLDSSIVAACLTQAPSKPQVTYLNFSLDVGADHEPLYLPGVDKQRADRMRALAGTGDERYFARLVAERWKTRIVERCITNSTDLTRLRQVSLKVRPVVYFGGMDTEDMKIAMASSLGTQAFFSGEAGDCVFLATQQPLSAIDYAYLHGINHGLWQHLISACKVSRESIWTVLAKTIRLGILGRPDVRKNPNRPTLLMERLTEDGDFQHPLTMLDSQSGLPAGKRNHITGLATSEDYYSRHHSDEHVDDISPLNSQPIWELLLQLPTYTILHGGVSRGLARYAFADLLPPAIHARQSKGSGTAFLQLQLRKNKEWLLDQLQNGLLVQEGYLDRQKLVDCLSAEEPFLIVDAAHLAACLSTEIWLQQWKDIREKQLEHSRSYGAEPIAM